MSWCDACKRADLEGSVNSITAKLQLQTASEVLKLTKLNNQSQQSVQKQYLTTTFTICLQCIVHMHWLVLAKYMKKSMQSYLKQEKDLIQDIFS